MDEIRDIKKEALNKKCDQHQFQRSDQLYIGNRDIKRRLCQKCIAELGIAQNEVVPLQKLFYMTAIRDIPNYPILIDKKLITSCDELDGCVEIFGDQIKSYKDSILETFEKALDRALQNNKVKVSKLSDNYNGALGVLQDVSDQEKLIGLVCKEKVEDLNEFVKQKIRIAQQTNEKLTNHINECKKIQQEFSPKQPDEIQNEVIELIKSVSFFARNELEKLNFFNSNTQFCLASKDFQQSKDSLSIQAVSPNKIIIQNKCNGWRQCYLNYKIQSASKYIIQLQLSNNSDNFPQFYFGLINSVNKDVTPLWDDDIFYGEYNGENTSTIQKGIQLHSGERKKIGNKDLEFRIHLAEEVFKVGQLPNYQNIAQLNSNIIIDKNKQYFFAIALCNKEDKVTITSVMEVTRFDNNM